MVIKLAYSKFSCIYPYIVLDALSLHGQDAGEIIFTYERYSEIIWPSE